jgi:hypothetical protein
MMRDGGLGQAHQRHQLADVERGFGEKAKDAQAGGIPEGAKGLRESKHIVA